MEAEMAPAVRHQLHGQNQLLASMDEWLPVSIEDLLPDRLLRSPGAAGKSQKSSLAQSLYAELKEYRINLPPKPSKD
jgi:hypothetical protein